MSLATQVTIPESIPLSLGIPAEKIGLEMKRALAVVYYREGKLTPGQCCELAEMDKSEFIEYLSGCKTSAAVPFENSLNQAETANASAAEIEPADAEDNDKPKTRGGTSSADDSSLAFFLITCVLIPVVIVPLTGIALFSIFSTRTAPESPPVAVDFVLRDGRDDYAIRRAGTVDHEVDMELYRPFRYGNRLAVMREKPNIVFTENFPRLDGATAAYPVFAAMAQMLYRGLDEYSITDYVNVSRTDEAMRRLINGEIDIFFGAQPSHTQRNLAQAAGVELTMTPVAREAFVFFVNSENPVENLTVSQIQDIYRRRFTNWSYLGGHDERILAFQRPENSGSQTIMRALVMEGQPMAQPVMWEEVGAMGQVMEQVAFNEYRNVSSAIGYSFRYFAVVMNPLDNLRILSVNGIAPTLKNILNDTYPFITNVYAITAGSENENTELLLDWILSEQGQRFVLGCGVVPVTR